MKIYYSCDNCGAAIDTLEVDSLDEARLGFDCLTDEERQAMIRYDAASGVLYVQSLCDACIAAMDLAGEAALTALPKGPLH
jgi:Protein of unknown function (DUF2757).